MIRWEILYVELTAEDLEFLETFWLSDHSKAIGFRVSTETGE
jgi:hypothetical protein